MSIGVRRAPKLVPSDEASVHLLASYLPVVTDDWDDVQAGRWRLALAVASREPAVRQVVDLAEIARFTPDDAAFRGEVERPARTNEAVRKRLGHLDALVAAAVAEAGTNLGDVDVGELTWRLLWALAVREIRLEGVDQTDRTSAVSRLRKITPEGSLTAADDLFSRLAALAGQYAPAGAIVTQSLLRRDLSGIPLGRSLSYDRAWRLLDALSQRLHDRTRFRLKDAHADLELSRAPARTALTAMMTVAGKEPGAVVVIGEPDVGKSALALRAAAGISAAGGIVTTLSLRDVPGTTFEFEGVLGGQLSDVLGGTAIANVRLLVIDGAESVLEGRRPLLEDVATAALRAGLGVVAVTRSDGAGAVRQALSDALAASGIAGEVHEAEVPRLTAAETEQVTATFTSLGRLGTEPRAAWLLGRPGLVELLLRRGAGLALPAGPLSEADVFAAIWSQLVRRGEVTDPGGPSPDARERALRSLARSALTPGRPREHPDLAVLPSLRSDGLLLAAGATNTWNPGDQFASDLVRDLSVAHLLLSDDFGLLAEASAPRWALRAARLACQAAISGPGAGTEKVWERLHSAFENLAAEHGSRWAEVPLEAVLTLGSPQEVLTGIWPRLVADQRSGLRTLIRLALQRYTVSDIGDPDIFRPLVELTFCRSDGLGGHEPHRRQGSSGTGEMIRELVLAWLRGLVKETTGLDALRRQVRDRLLATDPVPHDDFVVEALAMLGPDLDERVEGFLRGQAEDGGGHLAPAVEEIGPILAMSRYQPTLLVDLAEAFYIIPRDDDDEYGWSGWLEEGIRHHEKTGAPPWTPMAAWYHGPFWSLLNARPVEALALINRMLDRAAAARVARRRWNDSAGTPEEPPRGLDLDLPGAGVRRCVGDAHVWYWYRGSSVGPYPCMSALLAVERFADHLVDTLGIELGHVVELLLRECHNLAMPGLVVGLLVRHLEQSGDLLDRWLVRPELWRLESTRASAEGHLHVQGADAPELVGRERRRQSLREAAAELTLRAMGAGDTHRLEVLTDVGDRLLQHARAFVGNDDPEELAAVEGWAAVFRPENYHAHPTDEGGVLVQYEHPDKVSAGLAPSLASLARGSEAWRLLGYARSEERVRSVERLTNDIVLAREFAADPPLHGPPYPEDAPAAVAAAAVLAHAHGRASVPDDDLRWAARILTDVASRPRIDDISYESTIHPDGGDRSAAAALPLLLLPPFDAMALDRAAIGQSLQRSATSLFDEVRLAFADSVNAVWGAPCGTSSVSTTCRHAIAWAAVQDGLCDCRLGTWDQSGRRRVDPLDGPYDETLLTVETECLNLNRLTAPLVATASAARSASCVAGEARRLLAPLFDADRRGTDYWAKKGYGWPNDRRRPRVARLLIEAAVASETEELVEYVRVFTSNPHALADLLRDLAVVFTYDESLRPALLPLWRHVMTAALGAVESGAELVGDRHWSADALGGLLPTPQLDIGDRDPDAALGRARESWIAPDAIADLVARWLPLARRSPKAVDAVARLAEGAPPAWQATTGLVWTEELIDGHYDAVGGRCWFLTDWLASVRASGALKRDDTPRWRRLVDGLAAEGDRRAVELQRAEE